MRRLSWTSGIAAANIRPGMLLQALMLCIALHVAGAAPADHAIQNQAETRNVERAVKAAYLCKFLGYVEWPPALFAQPGAPFVIGIAGNDAIADELERISAGHSVDGRPLTVRRIRPDDTLAGVHLLYIGQVDGARRSQLLKLAQQRPILTVTDSSAGQGQGGIINFKLVDSHVRFDVALGAAERSGLRLSSRLLSVALKVETGASP